ncbi:hypothetical protein BMS3Abin05_00651 [bacterium BMS3Abin05]|nr:hypothetical protein BMS3Abin05_00651 [bacterium BMS3Abin05]GBE27164.1 hypothetical protein BMS3Bbin03_01088 [bacterium BMS3Bbin03]HDL78685.1 hypothetical protein [Bacteroidota bacterium]HDZ12241.1 hypothetical protein [Bacteroidota bacterium]
MSHKPVKISLLTIFKKWLWISYNHIGWLILLNFMTAILSLTVVGLGFAFSLIFFPLSKLLKNDSYSYSELRQDIAKSWKWSIGYGTLLLVIFLILTTNIYFYKHIQKSGHLAEWAATAIVVITIIYLMVSLWVIPTKIYFQESLKNSFKKAWILCFDNIKVSFAMFFVFIGMAFIGVYTGVVYFLLTFGLTASFIWVAFYEVMQKYGMGDPIPSAGSRTLKDLIKPWA